VDLGPLIAISIALGVLAWLAFLWSVRSGQYDDPEGPKYRMLEDDDELPAPPGARPDGPPVASRDAGPATTPAAPAERPPPEGPPRS
jgi:cbb3-type cytochrome oxidase maturation protein